MDFVEDIRVGKKRTETGIGAKQDRPSAIFGTWIVSGVRLAKDSSAQGDELARMIFYFGCHS